MRHAMQVLIVNCVLVLNIHGRGYGYSSAKNTLDENRENGLNCYYSINGKNGLIHKNGLNGLNGTTEVIITSVIKK
jgi:hypothetical protein